MKKSIIALLGLFTLVACSDDSVNKSDNLINQDESSGGMQVNTIDPNIPYFSPYDISSLSNFNFGIHNHTYFRVNLTPYVGLAFCDGIDDGTYNLPISGPVDLTQPEYSNLYFKGTEYLNLISCATIETESNLVYGYEASSLLPTIIPIGGPAHPIYYDVVGGGGSLEEANLLSDYGKVYYYEFEIIDPISNNVVYQDVIRLDFPSPAPNTPTWIDLKTTSIFNDKLYYHNTSLEIVAAQNNTHSRITFIDSGKFYDIYFYCHSGGVYFELTEV